MKPVFKLESYEMESFILSDDKDTVFCMHCDNEEEGYKFLSFLHNHNRKWCDGTPYTYHDYSCGSSNNVYYFNEGKYGRFDTAKRNKKVKILEFNDFNWDNKHCKFMSKKG